MAERRVVFWATWGVTLIERSSFTKSCASKALSAPSVIAPGRSAWGSIRARAATRSAWPFAPVRQAPTSKPEPFSFHEAQFGFLALALAIEPRVRIGGRGMGRVRALLASEVRLGIAPSVCRRCIRAAPRIIAAGVLGLEALHRSPGLNQRAVDREVVRR